MDVLDELHAASAALESRLYVEDICSRCQSAFDECLWGLGVQSGDR